MSSENNNVVITVKKNPLVFLIIVVVFVLVIVVIVKMRSDNNDVNNTAKPTTKPTTKGGFSNVEDIEDIVENYPQTTPMNIMYSDVNGNLAATSDLGLQNLTVNSDSSFGGNVGISGKVTAGSSKIGSFIDTPSLNRNDGDWLRINDQGGSVGQTAMYGGVCINDTRETHGGLSVGDWESNVGKGNIHATGRVFSDKNLQTIRNRVCFSNALDDPNHSIYNNSWDIDKEGAWDGMRMNVYAGLDIRTGNANGAVPKTSLSIRDDKVTVNGNLIANSFWIRKNNYLYYPEDAVYQNHNIFDLLGKGIISKYGNPGGWDETTWRTTKWPDGNGNNILRLGDKNSTDGLRVEVPIGKNVIWIRCLNDRWLSVQVYKIDGNIDLGNFCSGFRSLHKYAPDGGQHDSRWNLFSWFPIPVPGPGSYKIVIGNRANNDGVDGWIAGIAFSTNPWNHAFNCARAYNWNVNGGENVTWHSDNWNNDMLGQLTNGTITTMVVPIVPSGKDKLLYLIEHNNQWDGGMHRGITVDGTPIERLRSTWDHPLARSINSKMYNRFLAAFIPESLTLNKRFITVKIDMKSDMGNHIFFRESGTIDAY